jgi:cystathionine gamma-synthase
VTEKSKHPATRAAQALGWIDEMTRAVSPPLHASSTYIRDPDNQYRSGRDYIRADNPAFDQPEALLNALDGGAGAMLYSSGMAAATSVFLSLKPGDRVIAPKVMYWGLRNWLLNYARGWGLRADFVDMGDLAALKGAIQESKTKLVWIETPANPLWNVTDIGAVVEIAHKAGACVAADSTVATPVLTRPVEFGVDLVMHSATKYLNGHSDLIAGALVTRTDGEHWQRLKMLRAQQGNILGSFESWLLLRGMRTLYPRVRTACENAMALAERLSNNPHIAEVLYPGLPHFPGHAIAARQMQGGFGGMLSIRIKGGERAAIATAAHVEIWKRATSLGGVESLIEHRASVEGPGTPCPPDLLRLSAGIEDADDLVRDLEQALKAAHK